MNREKHREWLRNNNNCTTIFFSSCSSRTGQCVPDTGVQLINTEALALMKGVGQCPWLEDCNPTADLNMEIGCS